MANLTLLDIAKMNGNDAVIGLIEENLNAAPEAALWPMKTIKGTSYKTLVRLTNPTVGFRKANEGTAGVKSTYENRTVQCFILSEMLKVDVAVADANEDGADSAKAFEASGFMKGAMYAMGSQAYYGSGATVGNDADGFPGLIDFVTSDYIVDATGSGAGTGSSVYGLRLGPEAVSFVGGNGDGITLGDWSEQMVLDSGGTNYYNAYVASMNSWIGCQCVDKSAVGRIADLDATAVLTDVLIASLIEKAPVGGMWEYLYMNRRSLGQLQASRTATNGTGTPAPFPTEAFGIPIVVTDSITSTETLNYNLT